MTQLGRYEILQQLATGGVADVLLARASGLEGFTRHVVIKLIRPDLTADNRFAKEFLDEARIAGSLHHQNIVQVYDVDEQAGAYFFTMEYVHGEDLRKILLKVREANSMIPIDMAIAIATGAAAGLHHAHEQLGPDRKPLGLVHRDVSPGNILIGYDGSVKLVDFGLAKAALRSAKTRTGSLRGKAPYMSPELCCGKPVDRRSDTFALGIVLYELVTARRLFKAGNDFLTMAAIVDGTVEPPSMHRPDLPKRLDEIIMRALAKSPESRYQTADDLRGALEAFGIEAELRTSGKAVSDYMKKLFGARAEPWHDVAPPALDGNIDFDQRAGLVAAPEQHESLIAKLSSGATSPIALAQNVALDRPDPGFDDEEATRHDPALEMATPFDQDPPTDRSTNSTLSRTRSTTSNEARTRVDLPSEDDNTATIRPAPKRAPEPPADDESPTLRGRTAPVREQPRALPPVEPRTKPRAPTPGPAIDDDLITQRQHLTPPPAAPRPPTNTDVYETTNVTPPLFPAQHPTIEPRIANEPPNPRLPPAPTPGYRRWLVIVLAIVVPVAVAAIAIRSCSGSPASSTTPDASIVMPATEDPSDSGIRHHKHHAPRPGSGAP